MDRFSLTDAQWEKMEPFGLGKADRPRTNRRRCPGVC